MSVVLAPEFSWTLGSCATLPVCQFRRHPTKYFHHSRPVSGVGCGESSNTVPMEAHICQYTFDHYVIVTPTHRDTQTDRHCYYHWTSYTWIDLIGLRVDTFTETGSQQGTNRTLGSSNHLREITKISATAGLPLKRRPSFAMYSVLMIYPISIFHKCERMSRYTHVLRRDQQCRAPCLRLFLAGCFLLHCISDTFVFFGGKIVTGVLTPPRNFEGMGTGIEFHGEWQTRNDSLTIRECHFPNGKGNDHRWTVYSFIRWPHPLIWVVFGSFLRGGPNFPEQSCSAMDLNNAVPP